MNDALTVTDILPGFLDYLAADRHYSLATVKKYGDNVQWFAREIGNLPTASIGPQHFIALKARVGEHGGKTARMASIICAMKSLLAYARDVLAVSVIDLTKVKIPRSPRKEVIYLTKDELERFLSSIPLRKWTGEPRLAGYSFRAIAETLAATGMRISEVLSLDRDSINFAKKQAKIIGKGNKERTVFFTDRALGWITRYLDLRTDQGPALFTTSAGDRMKLNLVEAMFKRHVKALGFSKPVTPHVIRHTTATILLQNGCPIGFIKEILGHERLETTCRFYFGILNKADTQKAHQLYTNFDVASPPDSQQHLSLPQTDDSRGSIPSPLTDPIPPLLWKHQPVVLPKIWTRGQGKICGVGPKPGGDDDAETLQCSVQGEGGDGSDSRGQAAERTGQPVRVAPDADGAVEEAGAGGIGGDFCEPSRAEGEGRDAGGRAPPTDRAVADGGGGA